MPTQIDDFKRHVMLGEKAEAAALRGHELMERGDEEGARAALKEAEDAMAERTVIEARRRIQYPSR